MERMMNQIPNEVRAANIAFLIFWVLLVMAFLVFGNQWHPSRSFREKMLANWKSSLAIAALFIVSMGLSGRGFFNLHGITIFCQALIGLSLAQGIIEYDPLPVVTAFIHRERPWLKIGLMVLIATVVVIPAVIIGTIGLDVSQQIFNETDYTSQAMGTFPANKWAVFFMLLGGAGIAEETPFRLITLSLFWRLTKKRKLSIFLSAIVFGIYHLTPLMGCIRCFCNSPRRRPGAPSLMVQIGDGSEPVPPGR